MRPKLKIDSISLKRDDILELVEEAHFRKDWKLKRRLQVIWYAFSGKYTSDEIAELVGCSRASVTNWVKRWRSGGSWALTQNHYKPTRKPALTYEMMDDLAHQFTFGLIGSGGHGKLGEAIQVWLKERYDVELTIPAVDYWYAKILDRFYKDEFKNYDGPPKNPHKVDLGLRQRMKEREKKRAERDRRRRQLGLVVCA